MAIKLEDNGIIVNANTIPHDEAGPMRPSGIRMGTPAMTTKGYVERDFEALGTRIAKIIKKYYMMLLLNYQLLTITINARKT